MKKRLIIVLAAIIMCIGVMPLTPAVSAAAESSVSITLPNFKVTMNGHALNNDYSKYPLIVYKNITYFPMTYNDCRFLGIESTWTGNDTGLLVDSTGVTAAYNPYSSNERNRRTYTAAIPRFPISVNGKAVDNGKEEYPIISFRDITYFPMTWKYCVGEFAWDYSFDGVTGLVINSANAKLDMIALPAGRWVEEFGEYQGKKSVAVMAKNGFCYYVDDKGTVMQAPLSGMSNMKKIIQLPEHDSSYAGLGDHSFYEENGKAMLYFHVGGAVMGSDHRYVLKEDGTTQKIQDSYYETSLIGDKLYMHWQGPAPNPGMLYVMDAKDMGAENTGTDSEKSLGSADYWFHALCKTGGLPDFELIGNELYVTANKVLQNPTDTAGYPLADYQLSGHPLEVPAVYKVDTSTNTVARVNKALGTVTNAQIAGDYLYYDCFDSQDTHTIYKHSLKDASETSMVSLKGQSRNVQFAVIGECVYYVLDGNLCLLEGNVNLNPKAELLSMNVTGSNREFLACTFRETFDSKYRVMVFDKSGKAVFKTSDSGSNVIVEGNTLYFYNITTETLCKTEISK